MADDLGREPIPGVAGASGCPHPTRVLTPIRSRKRGKARQVAGAVCDQVMSLPSFAYTCAGCEVEVDPETGVVEIVRYTSIDDRLWARREPDAGPWPEPWRHCARHW